MIRSTRLLATKPPRPSHYPLDWINAEAEQQFYARLPEFLLPLQFKAFCFGLL